MNPIARILPAFVAVLSMAPFAHAATATFFLETRLPGQFELYVEVSQGDNGGIVNYGVPLLGNITSIEHLSPVIPVGVNAGGQFGPAGFSEVRSLDGATLVSGGQHIILPTPHLIRGFGQTANSFLALGITPITPAEQPFWHSSLLLARGTHSGPISFDQSNVNLLVDVFQSPTSQQLISAQVQVNQFGGLRILAEDTDLGERAHNAPIPHLFDARGGGQPYTWSNLVHYGPAVGNAAVLNADGSFSWDPSGAARGFHVFEALVTGTGRTDLGRLFVTIVPEPASATLVALGIVGTCIWRRKR